MGAVAPLSAAEAAAKRHDNANDNFNQLDKGALNTAHYASEAQYDAGAFPHPHYESLDTVADQQVPTSPIAALPALPPDIVEPPAIGV